MNIIGIFTFEDNIKFSVLSGGTVSIIERSDIRYATKLAFLHVERKIGQHSNKAINVILHRSLGENILAFLVSMW